MSESGEDERYVLDGSSICGGQNNTVSNRAEHYAFTECIAMIYVSCPLIFTVSPP